MSWIKPHVSRFLDPLNPAALWACTGLLAAFLTGGVIDCVLHEHGMAWLAGVATVAVLLLVTYPVEPDWKAATALLESGAARKVYEAESDAGYERSKP